MSSARSPGPPRIDVITPHGAAGADAEWPVMAPDGVNVRVARIPAAGGSAEDPGPPPSSPDGLRELATPAILDAAVASLVPDEHDAIGWASSTTGYVIGHEAEAALLATLSQRRHVPTDSTSAAAVRALRALDVDRIAIVNPPWFGDDMNEYGVGYFESQGFRVTSSELVDLPNDPQQIEPAEVVTWISHHVPDAAQAVYLGGNGFRTVGAIDPLERLLGRPVLTANQVLLWSLTKLIGRPLELSGYGVLFRT